MNVGFKYCATFMSPLIATRSLSIIRTVFIISWKIRHLSIVWPSFFFFQGFGRLSLVAASAAQSAASVVQAGTKDLTSKVLFTVLTILLNVRCGLEIYLTWCVVRHLLLKWPTSTAMLPPPFQELECLPTCFWRSPWNHYLVNVTGAGNDNYFSIYK